MPPHPPIGPFSPISAQKHVTDGCSPRKEAGGQFAEVCGVIIRQRSLVRASSEADLLGMVEGVAGEASPNSGKLQAVQVEGEFAGVTELLFDHFAGGLRHQCHDARGCISEAELRSLQIRGMEKA